MMERTQISLDAELHRRAKGRASDLGISLAEYVRQLVRRDVDEPRASVDPSVLFNLGRSSGSHVAMHKDRYLAEAIESERQPEGSVPAT